MSNTWQATLDERDDLKKYGGNALGLFALVLHFGLEDIESVATDAVIDGSDDKKCDIVYIDRNDRVAVVAQCFCSQKQKAAAPANKASDLSTAIGWLLNAEVAAIPMKLRSPSQILRQALEDLAIDKVHIWYVHNLPESRNVERELQVVETSSLAMLRDAFPKVQVQVHAKEVGKNTFEEWYVETLTPILVTDEFKIKTNGAFQLKMGKWKACVAAIQTSFLRKVYRDNSVRLFSANVRDYLGARRSDSNINNGIIQTAKSEPDNFWAYNNGITVLVNDFSLSKRTLTVRGLSVVNGAQTTGALGSVNEPLSDAWVQARFIKTADQEIVSNVIRYNNSQNKVTAADFRSTDRLQKRLREEFDSIPDAEYEGGRRGGSDSVIRRRKNLLPSFTVGQAIASLHGEPETAYNEKSAIWERDTLYTKYFNDGTSAAHIVFAYSLLRAVEARKLELVAKAKDSSKELTKSEEAQLTFFRNRGATYLAAAAIAGCLEVVLARKVSSMFRLSFGNKVSPERGQEHWGRIVSTLAPMFPRLEEALKPRLDNPARVTSTIDVFRELVEATAEANKSIYAKFRGAVHFK
jgi:hypothetical protein